MRTATPIVLALLIAISAITAVGGIAVMTTHTAIFSQTNPSSQVSSNSPPSHPAQITPNPSQAQQNQTCGFDDCSDDD